MEHDPGRIRKSQNLHIFKKRFSVTEQTVPLLSYWLEHYFQPDRLINNLRNNYQVSPPSKDHMAFRESWYRGLGAAHLPAVIPVQNGLICSEQSKKHGKARSNRSSTPVIRGPRKHAANGCREKAHDFHLRIRRMATH